MSRHTDGLPAEEFASQFYLGDCLEIIPKLADESIDLLLVDPPYGINYLSRSTTLPKVRVTNDGPEAYELLDKALALILPKMKVNSHAYIFTTWQAFASMEVVVRKHLNLKNALVWEKNNRTRGDLKGNYGYQHEMIFFAHKGRRYLNGSRDANILKFKKVPTQYMVHTTEKPLELLEYLIFKSTSPGEVVLDSFAGSGSSCVAAKRLGRRYIGIELEEVWYSVAMKRLERESWPEMVTI